MLKKIPITGIYKFRDNNQKSWWDEIFTTDDLLKFYSWRQPDGDESINSTPSGGGCLYPDHNKILDWHRQKGLKKMM